MNHRKTWLTLVVYVSGLIGSKHHVEHTIMHSSCGEPPLLLTCMAPCVAIARHHYSAFMEFHGSYIFAHVSCGSESERKLWDTITVTSVHISSHELGSVS